MNIALSPVHRASVAGPSLATGRHPFGLAVVIGLHAVLATALLTAHMLRTAPHEKPPIDILPEPPKPPAPHQVDELQPPQAHPHVIYVEPPLVPIDPTPQTPQGVTTQKPDGPPVDPNAGQTGVTQVAIAEPPHFKPRAGHLDANAAGCHPDYPAAAQRAGATGVSHIRFTISASGQVVDARILQPSGPTREHRLLDQAAAAALAQCPVTVGADESGHAVASTSDVEYVWSLPN